MPGARRRHESRRIRKAARIGGGLLEAWFVAQGTSPLELTPARADDWIADLRSQGRPPATFNVDVAAASSFWTWMERRHNQLKMEVAGVERGM